MPNSVIITGHKGDIGTSLLRSYQNNSEFSAFPYGQDEVKDAKRLIHLAAKHPVSTDKEIIRSNILFLEEVIDYSVQNNINEFIFFSSTSVYGKQDREGVAEDCSFNNPDLYGTSKILGERLLESSNLRVVCLRLPAVLELRNSHNLLSSFFDKLIKDEGVSITNPDKLFNNFISAENIYDFINNLKFKRQFDSFNLAVERKLTLQDVVTMLKDILNSNSNITVSDRKSKFFSLSIDKAVNEYQFKPADIKSTLTSWCEERITELKL